MMFKKIADQTETVDDTRVSPLVPRVSLTREYSSFLTSMVIHSALLILLALIAFPEIKNSVSLFRIDSGQTEGEDHTELVRLEALEMTTDESADPYAETPVLDISELQQVSNSQIDPSIDISELLEDVASDRPIDADSLLGEVTNAASDRTKSRAKRPKSAIELMASASKRGKYFQGPLLKEPRDGMRQTRSTSHATEGVLDQLREAMGHDGPVWIVWVMDASISLVAERQEVAPIIKNFYDEVKASRQPGSWPWPSTAVFAFGHRVVPLGVNSGQPRPQEIANTLINVPIDETGIENVMTAVASAIASIPAKNRKTRIEVVVWTDESGDDLNALEDVIMLCRRRNARVHVVGPLSVLGMRKGLQQFSLPPPYDMPILLPVDRGPDSAFPERAQLPYWYESTDIDWGNGPIIPAGLGAKNFGGPHRQRLLAPSGPYALTRLALATGGTFTALNRPGDLATASREQLFEYMPDYRSAFEIAYDIDRYPLRRAVIEAAALTGAAEYWPPKMRYPTRLDDQFPYRSIGFYQTPQRFAQQLPGELQASVMRLRPAQVMIEQAIQIMMLRFDKEYYVDLESDQTDRQASLSEIALEQMTPSEYHHEQSPRWKAWYDLNLGRLLAHSVRIHEFMLRCEIMASSQSRMMILQGNFNRLTLQPSSELLGGTISATRLQAAIQLLQRVVRDHADTPWGDLATWELQHPVGVVSAFSRIPEPRPVARVVVPPRPAQPLPPMPPLPRL